MYLSKYNTPMYFHYVLFVIVIKPHNILGLWRTNEVYTYRLLSIILHNIICYITNGDIFYELDTIKICVTRVSVN